MTSKSRGIDLSGLRATIGRDDAVLDAPDVIAAHSHDAWPLNAPWRQQGKSPYRPQAVVIPTSVEEVSAVLRWATAERVPVTPWGLASSVVGGPLPTGGGLVLDISRMSRILSIDTESMQVKVEAGINGGTLEEELGLHGVTLGHSPQSLHRSTVGGWLATRASGQFSSRYGGIEELCAGFTAVLADGTTVKVGGAPRMAVGPDLRQLLIGSEGCLAVFTDVTLRLFPRPEHRELSTLTFPDVESGIAAMRAIMLSGIRPFLLRFYDLAEARHAMKDPSFASPVMFLGSEGRASLAKLEMKELGAIAQGFGGKPIGPVGAAGWMERRFDFSTIEAVLAREGGVAETIEVAHTWSGIGATYHALTRALAPYVGEVLGHFSHAYTDGVSLYVILLGSAGSARDAEARMRTIWEVANRTALDTGAVLSHHHGTGLARSAFVREALGGAWLLYERIKAALDPQGILNPGKLGR